MGSPNSDLRSPIPSSRRGDEADQAGFRKMPGLSLGRTGVIQILAVYSPPEIRHIVRVQFGDEPLFSFG